jgi:hypothetical protein
LTKHEGGSNGSPSIASPGKSLGRTSLARRPRHSSAVDGRDFKRTRSSTGLGSVIVRSKPDLPQRIVGFPERPFRLDAAEMINRAFDTGDELLERLHQLRSRLSEAVPYPVALLAIEPKSGWRRHQDIAAVIAMCLLMNRRAIAPMH